MSRVIELWGFMNRKVALTELQSTGIKQRMTLDIDPRLAAVELDVAKWTNHCLRKSDFAFSSHNPKDCHERYLVRASQALVISRVSINN